MNKQNVGENNLRQNFDSSSILNTTFDHRCEQAKTVVSNEKWYAIYTKSRFENKLYHALQKAGNYQAFLPLVKEKRLWSDRVKTVEVPMIPGYVFVKISCKEIRNLYPYPGFVRMVSSEGKPCEVQEKEIALLEQIMLHGFQVQSTTTCKIGDKVRIIRGPLKGWEGRVESKRGVSRIVFHFDCIQRAISIEVGVGDVEKV